MVKRILLSIALLFVVASGAQAIPITYVASLSGPAENPPNASPGTGFATVIYDSSVHSLSIDVSFSGLLGTTTASHIHCCTAAPGTAGVATVTPTFPGFPLGVTSGTYANNFDLTLASSFNSAFVTASGGTAADAEAALAAGLDAGTSYFNIHTNLFPGGEIRGFLTESVSVPEPAGISLFGLGLCALLAGRRKSMRGA